MTAHTNHDEHRLGRWLNELRRLAPSGYALALHIRFASAQMMFVTYPQEWVEQYTESDYLLCDPTISWALGQQGMCRWSGLAYPDPHNVMGQAREYGLIYGFTVSHGPRSSRSVGSFGRADREFTDEEMARIAQIVAQLHDAATPPESLTPAQRNALKLVASGARYAEAAERLGISESAFKARLKAARERLLARTTAEAIQRAQEHKLL
ncbi:helix-turn-helix transcriptional regulator [Tranquillimonas alkanivorans]|uniref:LuxR family transcriptional regulator n=1 Tax=Tranquillimonas alkanivorans TaxID=441119 RepID=A0A1I5SX01_9RHOB|nr:LuxR family transcriptional regulator [Tranquillimonas alkanivorans]SFP75238.1 LuxR family transcriptional regulator [Tranquillimonas alkanivorans]